MGRAVTSDRITFDTLIIAPIQTKVRWQRVNPASLLEVEDSPPQGKVRTVAGCFLDAVINKAFR
jgi:hypothetical protein